MYRLRTGLNQEELAQALNLNSRRMVQYWEAGNGIPKAENLKKLIGLYFQLGVFRAGEEREEAEELWNIVKDYYEARNDRYGLYSIFDAEWFENLLPVKPKTTLPVSPPVHLLSLTETEPDVEESQSLETTTTEESKEADQDLIVGESVTADPFENWPGELTSFIGREKELAEIQKLLSINRLVTITGLGGTGKTRLALKVAETVARDFENKIFFVNLANLTDPALVAPTIAQVLGLAESAGSAPVQAVKNYLKNKKVLLVLDNFEQLTAATYLLADWLTHAPRLKLLVTSRVVLNLYGEQHYPLPPLPLPTGEAAHWDILQSNPAIHLFVERARLYRPDFSLTKANNQTILKICTLLDGLPLALELAAARIKFLSPQKLLEKLAQHRLRLPGESSYNLARRHQTLYDTLDWSYTLLSEAAQLLFCRLAVFSRSWTLEEAEEICSGRGLETNQIAELVSRLIDHSLLTVEIPHHEAEVEELRYYLLETIREYALEKLLDSGETEVWKNAAVHFTQAGDDLRYSNFGLARLHYSDALRTAGYLPEGNEKIRQQADLLIKYISVSFAVVERPKAIKQLEKTLIDLENLAATENSPADRLRTGWVHYWIGYLLYLLEGSPDLNFPHCQIALSIAEELNQTEFAAVVKMTIGRFLMAKGYYQKAAPYFKETALLLEKSDNWTARINANLAWAQVLIALGHYGKSVRVAEQALAEASRVNNLSRLNFVYVTLGIIFSRVRNWQKCYQYAKEGIPIARQTGETFNLIILLFDRALASANLGYTSEAREVLTELLMLVESQTSNVNGQAYAVAALTAISLEETEQALQLAQKAVAVSKEAGGLEGTGLGYLAWAMALSKKGTVPRPEVEHLFWKAHRTLEECGLLIDLANTSEEQADYYQSIGDSKAAEVNYYKAMKMFEDFGISERVEGLKIKLENLEKQG
jgi:predicted ATPase/transcriptional regulator with XRE-family HTH domain